MSIIYSVSARIYLFKPREAMFVFFVLGILLLYHSDASLPQKRKGDYPDANEVIQKLPQTYMLQSVENYSDLSCGYQVFYSGTYGNKTYSNYDLFFFYMDGSLFNQPLYIRNVTGYIITLSIEPGLFAEFVGNWVVFYFYVHGKFGRTLKTSQQFCN
ncbi:uncharacterized protein LOC120845887 [Ixodes scapularis]|uniref:uncharacterized protein LOC120845887 n=1 Tax=Ixodes scapularis TaxID=6945 RepID=UPI001A9F6169|nr:uncharacterized protein LOC120845887 [Ixodes scapularis]